MSHFPDSIVKSGGVNIFFVISGFLIAQIVEQKYKHALFGFYKSRIQSLFPQLLIISIIIYISFLFFGEYEYIKRFYDSCKYAVIGILNIFFIREEVTYGQESFLNPFGPFWAFSVIIQYYITYGLIYKFVINKRNTKLSTLSNVILLTTLSVVIYFTVYAINPNSKLVNFYSLLTRYWQFLAGASLYYFLLKNSISEKKKNIFILLAFLMLIAWQLLEVFNTNFQIKTILISFIGLLVIAASGASNLGNKFLSSKLLTRFGQLSYPFYLWHMAFIYYAYLYLTEVNNADKLYITSLILIFSAASIKLNSLLIKSKYIIFFTISSVILLSLMLQNFNKNIENYIQPKNYWGTIDERFKKSYPNTKPTQENLTDNKGIPCHQSELKLNCNFNKNNENKVILLGTSQLATFTKTLTEMLISQNYNVHVITRNGCPYLPNFYRNDTKCTKESMNDLKNYLLTSKKATVVIAQRFPLYLSTNYYTNSKGFSEANAKLEFLNDENKSVFNGFNETLKSLTDYGHNLVLVYPIPEFAEDVPNYYRKVFSKLDFKEFKEPKIFYDKRTEDSFILLDGLKSDNIERVYPSDFLCDDSYCYSMIDNKILYSDDDHLNQNGVDLIAPEILRKINRLSLPTQKNK